MIFYIIKAKCNPIKYSKQFFQKLNDPKLIYPSNSIYHSLKFSKQEKKTENEKV